MWTPLKMESTGFGPPRTPPVEGMGEGGMTEERA